MLSMPNLFLSSSHILVVTTLVGRYYYFYIFTNENTERLLDLLRPHSRRAGTGQKWGQNPGGLVLVSELLYHFSMLVEYHVYTFFAPPGYNIQFFVYSQPLYI